MRKIVVGITLKTVNLARASEIVGNVSTRITENGGNNFYEYHSETQGEITINCIFDAETDLIKTIIPVIFAEIVSFPETVKADYMDITGRFGGG